MLHQFEVGMHVRVTDKYAGAWDKHSTRFIGQTGTIVGIMASPDRIDVIFPRKHPRGRNPVGTFSNIDCLEPVAERPDPVVPLPSGDSFLARNQMSSPDHWLHEVTKDGYTPPPPMPLRMGASPERDAFEEKIRAAARWAVKASTKNGKDMSFDPDAMVGNFILGLLGHNTTDGLGGRWENPDVIPPEFMP